MVRGGHLGHSALVFAASAAAAAVLATSGFAIGAAPWAEAAGNVAATAQGGGSHPASGQPGSFLFNTINGTKTPDGKTTGGVRLDSAAGRRGRGGQGSRRAPAAKPVRRGHPAAKPAAKPPSGSRPVRKPAAEAARRPAEAPCRPAEAVSHLRLG